ncbi:MAG: pentapeptide repeat-containing protein [Anaerolineae bacterium]|nr:pentapeptide repeat-containing protein [Anaerolineae bacterium]
MKNRWEEIRNIWSDNQWPLLLLTGWMLGLLTIPALRILNTDIASFVENLVPEAVGIAFTVLILDRLNENRAREALQDRLLREASGQANEAAKAAIDWMRSENWHAEPVSLMKGYNFTRARLDGAALWRGDLEGSNFYKAELSGANIYRADLRNANLAFANLTRADLIAADLRGANLQGAILKDVKWYHHKQDSAILPDGSKWTAETDLERFTNAEHPQFWRSDDPKSPAYPGRPVQG